MTLIQRLPSRITGFPTDAGAVCYCSAMSMLRPPGEFVILRVAGEVDLSTVSVLRDALADVLRSRPRHLIVDLADLTFCSVRGLTVLIQAKLIAAERGTDYTVCGASRHLNRVWTAVAPGGDLPIRYPTVAVGVIAAMVRQNRSA